MQYPVSHAAITFSPETGKFGFKVWMPGHKPHFVMVEAFETRKAAVQWLDPHGERIWEVPPTDDASIVAVSKGYKPDSAPMRDVWKQ
jgi:hypothetical protein